MYCSRIVMVDHEILFYIGARRMASSIDIEWTDYMKYRIGRKNVDLTLVNLNIL